MTGRGFLKSHLAAQIAKNLEESKQKPKDELPKADTSAVEKPKPDHVPNVPDATVLSGIQHAIRGRRAMMAHISSLSDSKSGLGELLTAQILDLNIHAVPPKVSSLITPPASAVVSPLRLLKPHLPSVTSTEPVISINEDKNEKSPVICRVTRKSDKDSYQIIQLSSNYIKIALEKNKGIYEYRVDYNPPVDVRTVRFALLNEHRSMFPVKTFDGTLLYLPTMLPKNVTILEGKLRDESKVTMTLTFKRKNSLRECIHFYNVFLRTIMKNLGLIEFGRSCYDKEKKILIPEFQLEVWPGFVTTIDEFEDGLYMCCEVSHRVLRVQTVLQVMTDVGAHCKKTNSDYKQEIMAALCGSTVITHYNRKTYRVDDIEFLLTPLSTFEQNGTKISYVDYYKKMYNIEIKNLNQPMLITKAKKKDLVKKDVPKDSDICCLVPELCNLTGLSEKMKSDFKLMKALQAHTLVTPEVRQKSIVDFINRINEHETASKKFKDWGLIVRPVPVKLEGPVYKRETILLGNCLRKQVGVNMDWGMDVAKNAMFSAVNLINWAILFNVKDEPTAKNFCKTLSMCGRPLGMDIRPPAIFQIPGVNPESFVNTISRVKKNVVDLQLIVIIFPNLREDRYNAVKRICCADLGIPSQVIIARTLSRPERVQSITQKIALQINCKLGGACWAIDIPLKATMIIGIDVYHEKGKQSSSVVGFVASMDITFTKWYSVAGMQKSTHQELLRSIQESFHKSIVKFKEINGLLPEKIIIYRDGVSDGDLKHVEEVELKDLAESFRSYPGDYCPKVTCIIVQKRINTRVFQFLNERYSNPSSGTVLDNTVTRRNYFDFFLVSQHVRQGTVNPTHYIVLLNECNLSIENVQRLSYKLCHLYYNWCGTVKVPAPVQYAHKLAYLIGQNVRKMPDENLCNTLFFL